MDERSKSIEMQLLDLPAGTDPKRALPAGIADILHAAADCWPDAHDNDKLLLCGYFYCFQQCHRSSDADSILLGDYYFSSFMRLLSEIRDPVLSGRFFLLTQDFINGCCFSPDSVLPLAHTDGVDGAAYD